LFSAPVSVEALHVAKGLWGRKGRSDINSQGHGNILEARPEA
jgi:hypothetical protein